MSDLLKIVFAFLGIGALCLLAGLAADWAIGVLKRRNQ